MFVLYTYDVEAGRTQKFKKLLGEYLGHEQNSFFYGNLRNSSLVDLRNRLSRLLIEGDKLVEIVAENRNNVSIRTIAREEKHGPPRTRTDDRHKKNMDVL